MESDKHCYLIRHAQSELNKGLASADRSNKSAMFDLRFGPTHMDACLSEEGKVQALNLAAEVQDLYIKKVFVSPMRRALETAHILFTEHPLKPEVVVVPFISEPVKSAHGISIGNQSDVYPGFCWDMMPAYPYILDHIEADEARMLQAIGGDHPSPEILLKRLIKKKSRGLESKGCQKRRLQLTIDFIRREFEAADGSVAVVSHSKYSQSLMELVNGIGSAPKVRNCQIMKLNI